TNTWPVLVFHGRQDGGIWGLCSPTLRSTSSWQRSCTGSSESGSRRRARARELARGCKRGCSGWLARARRSN
ncbi:hypothetical protein LTR95_009732, partial [Oleoguttula sp. CCFEE 5521]